jgi:hypothetical protein
MSESASTAERGDLLAVDVVVVVVVAVFLVLYLGS